jgi:hypothetical protein
MDRLCFRAVVNKMMKLRHKQIEHNFFIIYPNISFSIKYFHHEDGCDNGRDPLPVLLYLYCICPIAEDLYYGEKFRKILRSNPRLFKLTGHIFLLSVLTKKHPQCVAQTPNRLDTSLDSLFFMRNFCVLVSAC